MSFGIPSHLTSYSQVAYDSTAFNLVAYSFGLVDFGYYQMFQNLFLDLGVKVGAADVSGKI